jgi:putative ABC transport system permease protein
LTLLTGAGLLIQSFLNLKRIEPGFNPDRLIVYSLNIPVHHYGKYETGGTNAARAQLFASLEHEIPTIPGVKSVTVTALLPLRQLPNPWGMHIEGRPEPPPDATGVAAANIKPGLYKHGEVSIQRVSPGYFETFEIPLIAGRAFDSRDNANAPLAAIINETTARRYFAGEDPIGKTIVLNMTSYFPKMTIIGIARDSKMNTLDGEINPQVFWSIAQLPSANSWLAVRVHAESPGIDSAVQNQIRDIDSDIAIAEVKTMSDIADDALWRQRLSAALFAMFATLAVVLAAAGIYAVFSYLVTRRTRETGIRIALGASRRQVLGQIVGSALKLVVTGILVGIVAVALTGRFLSMQLYGIQTSDPATTVIAAMFLILVSLIASCIPAWRAARTDAVVVLRD